MPTTNQMTPLKSHPDSPSGSHDVSTKVATDDLNASNGDYFYLDAFAAPGAGERFMAVMPPAQNEPAAQAPSGLPSYSAHLWNMPVLNQEQEHHVFRKLNYLKYLLHAAESGSETCVGYQEMIDDADALQASIIRTRNFLVESNLRLVVSIARRQGEVRHDMYDELLCVGNEALLRAVDLFDFRRGIRFSTYAYRAIERAIYGTYRQQKRYRKHVVGDGEAAIVTCERDASASDLAILNAAESAQHVAGLLQHLNQRDRHIVMARFGMGRSAAETFKVIAKEVSLSTTRTVQLFNSSIEKLRHEVQRRNSA